MDQIMNFFIILCFYSSAVSAHNTLVRSTEMVLFNFRKHLNSKLEVSNDEIIKEVVVYKEEKCHLECLGSEECLSLNIENKAEEIAKKCQLLKTDMYKSQIGKLTTTSEFTHISIASECDKQPCLNGGTCSPDYESGEYQCTCAVGYKGNDCQQDINECSSNPCQNGGTCVDEVNGYTCSCASGYTGTHCETDINECSSYPCQNGGNCVDEVNGYSCFCGSGYTGTRCETAIPDCSGYTSLDDISRHVNSSNQYNGGKIYCDDRDTTGLDGNTWFRLVGASGTRMPTTCPPIWGCSTHGTIWINGDHPAETDGMVSRQACIHWTSNCCQHSKNIKVANCGHFYIYQFVTMSWCSSRYCGTDE